MKGSFCFQLTRSCQPHGAVVKELCAVCLQALSIPQDLDTAGAPPARRVVGYQQCYLLCSFLLFLAHYKACELVMPKPCKDSLLESRKDEIIRGYS